MLPAWVRPATSWVPYTTSCNTQSSAAEDGQNNCPKHVELTGIINKPLLLHLVGCLYYLYQWCTVKQISDNEIYLLIKYIKSVLWRVAKRMSCIEDARCLIVHGLWLRATQFKFRQCSANFPYFPILPDICLCFRSAPSMSAYVHVMVWKQSGNQTYDALRYSQL